MLSELCWGGNASIVQGNGSDDSDLEDSEDEKGADSEETWSNLDDNSAFAHGIVGRCYRITSRCTDCSSMLTGSCRAIFGSLADDPKCEAHNDSPPASPTQNTRRNAKRPSDAS